MPLLEPCRHDPAFEKTLVSVTPTTANLLGSGVATTTGMQAREGVLYCAGRARYQLEQDCWLLDQLEPNQPLGYQYIGYGYKTP